MHFVACHYLKLMNCENETGINWISFLSIKISGCGMQDRHQL